MFDSVDRIWQIIIGVIFAMLGGLARLLNKKDQTKLQWSMILSELFISGFAGLMVLFLARSFGLEGDWLGLVCGIAGWVGPRILDMIAKPAGRSIGIDIDEAKEK